MKVFVSGVAGFLGSHLAENLLKEGHEVVGCDSLIGGDISNVPEGVEFLEWDCTNFKDMENATEGCDVVYHCAALAYEGLSVFSPALVTKSIVQATIGLLSASIHNKVKRFVYLSSMARYGTQDTLPFTEDMTPKPQDPYGIGKVCGEELVKNLCEVHGIEWTIAVPHNIIGPKQKYDDPYRNVASIFINRMMKGEQPILYGDGSQKRCFSFVQDCVDCLMKMGFNKNVVGQIINIGPDDEFITIKELATYIAEILEFQPFNPEYLPGRPQEVKLANCSNQKARKLLGFNPKYSLVQGLCEMIFYIEKQGTKPFKYHLPLEIINDLTPKSWKDQLI